jgi:hypothetical protein
MASLMDWDSLSSFEDNTEAIILIHIVMRISSNCRLSIGDIISTHNLMVWVRRCSKTKIFTLDNLKTVYFREMEF